MTVTTLESREPLIQAMQDPAFYDHDVKQVIMLQTHISWVFLTGQYAYKVKKPMDFGFLNFTELKQRKHFCEEEIRLNKRLAKDIYLQTVNITGSESSPVLNGDGDIIEYAVKMQQFDQSQLIDKLLKNTELQPYHIDQMADQAANFHQTIDRSPSDSELGSAASVNAPVIQNFDQLDPLIKDSAAREQLQRLRNWSQNEFEKISSTLQQRKTDGFIRECHGDMHLGNMALINDQVSIFDGIEFNDEFRWIDVMSEVAFLFMDLVDRNASGFAYRFLNRYLEHSGDYASIKVLRFYLVYRAMVRAKIASFTLLTPDLPEKDKQASLAQYKSYTDLAEAFTQISELSLSITHGVSGCGKTTVSQKLLEQNSLIRVRSDIERKRLFDLKATESSKSPLDAGIYNQQASAKTYLQLQNFAKMILDSGFSVIVDATFLHHADRIAFQELASEYQAGYNIIEFDVDKATLQQRISKRLTDTNNASEADLAVLEKQLSHFEPLEENEKAFISSAAFL
ncbi:MAG: AAA family ATPase [Gammaproteobacteria bacterium]|nr:AAA family ATPase [Gammaproteobacteria bacterium]